MEIRVYRADSKLTHMAISGRMDSAGVTLQEEGFLALTAGRSKPCIVELADVSFMVSIGMRMLIEAAKTLSGNDAAFILVGPRGLVSEALHIAKLDELFTIVPDVAQAIGKIDGMPNG